MADALVNNFKVIIMNGGLDLDTDTIHVALITSSWTPNIDTDVYFQPGSLRSFWYWIHCRRSSIGRKSGHSGQY